MASLLHKLIMRDKWEEIMKKAIQFTLLTILFFIQAKSFASITCHTPRLSKAFQINSTSVAFYQNDVAHSREIASTIPARTRFTGQGFTKVIINGGNKYTLHIENKNSFSEVDDYLTIKNDKGHEMTYPITCYEK